MENAYFRKSYRIGRAGLAAVLAANWASDAAETAGREFSTTPGAIKVAGEIPCEPPNPPQPVITDGRPKARINNPTLRLIVIGEL